MVTGRRLFFIKKVLVSKGCVTDSLFKSLNSAYRISSNRSPRRLLVQTARTPGLYSRPGYYSRKYGIFWFVNLGDRCDVQRVYDVVRIVLL